jgi:hypothetical protein
VRILDGGAEELYGATAVEILDAATGARLFVVSVNGREGVTVEPRWSSREYGSKTESAAAVWTLRGAAVPLSASWWLVPVCAGEDVGARLELLMRLRAGRSV